MPCSPPTCRTSGTRSIGKDEPDAGHDRPTLNPPCPYGRIQPDSGMNYHARRALLRQQSYESGCMRKRKEDLIRVSQEIEATEPVLVAAWPGVANVALTAINYLAGKLGATEFARMQALPFFDLNGAMIERNIIQAPRLPENRFLYWKREGAGGDLILFTSEAQPAGHSYDLANRILDFAATYNVKRVYTLAAALVQEFSEKPRVWAAATNMSTLSRLQECGLVLKGNFYVAGMNGLLLSVAREKGMDGTCLLGETPRYLSEIDNPIASQSVLEALIRLLGLEIDMSEMQANAKRARAQIDQAIMEGRRQYIDRFTVPLWERPQEDEKG